MSHDAFDVCASQFRYAASSSTATQNPPVSVRFWGVR